MARLYASKLMRIIIAVAMVVQLGLVAYHHHDMVVDHEAAYSVVSHADHHAVEHAHHHGHEDHEPGEQHHHPVDGDSHECDLCLLKTAVGTTLVPDTGRGFGVTRTSTKLHFVRQDGHKSGLITDRYRTRAPPSRALLL